jgi:hypothetical protein
MRRPAAGIRQYFLFSSRTPSVESAKWGYTRSCSKVDIATGGGASLDLNLAKDVLVPIAIGVLSSFVFLLLASRLRPSIDISREIAKMPVGGCGPSAGGYAIKVVNKSKRTAIEVRARLALTEPTVVPGGSINATTDYVLEKDSLFELPGQGREAEDSAFRFITYQDIEASWHDGKSYILFSLVAKDSLSGFGKAITRKYEVKRDKLKSGVFEVGSSMRIV